MTEEQAQEILKQVDNFLTLNNGNTLNVWLNTILYNTLNNMLGKIVEEDNPKDDNKDNSDENKKEKLPLINESIEDEKER